MNLNRDKCTVYTYKIFKQYAEASSKLFKCVSVTTYQGEVLRLTKVSRSEMGAYLCIGSNGVPPSVSKRITVSVHCKYNMGIKVVVV